MQPSNVQLVFAAITPIVEAFEQLGVDYHIGGSVASSAHGIIRATFDADLVAVLRQEHVRPFVKLLEGNYYIDADAVRDAIRRKSSLKLFTSTRCSKLISSSPKLACSIRKNSIEYS